METFYDFFLRKGDKEFLIFGSKTIDDFETVYFRIFKQDRDRIKLAIRNPGDKVSMFRKRKHYIIMLPGTPAIKTEPDYNFEQTIVSLEGDTLTLSKLDRGTWFKSSEKFSGEALEKVRKLCYWLDKRLEKNAERHCIDPAEWRS